MFTNSTGLTDTSEIYRAPYVAFDDFDKDTHTAEKVILVASILMPGGLPEAVGPAVTTAATADVTASEALNEAASLSSMRNYDYPLASDDIGATGFVRSTTPWQRSVIERPGAIDWDFVRPEGAPQAGLTNLQAAKLGWAPGRVNPETGAWDPVVLHHVLDDPRGSVMQAWLSDHTAYHNMIGREPNPWRFDVPDWASAWRDEVPAYWRWRTGAYYPAPQSAFWLPGDP